MKGNTGWTTHRGARTSTVFRAPHKLCAFPFGGGKKFGWRCGFKDGTADSMQAAKDAAFHAHIQLSWTKGDAMVKPRWGCVAGHYKAIVCRCNCNIHQSSTGRWRWEVKLDDHTEDAANVVSGWACTLRNAKVLVELWASTVAASTGQSPTGPSSPANPGGST